jgi:hypothetical protein
MSCDRYGAPCPYGLRQWANPKLSEVLGPSMSAKVAPDGLNRGTPLRSVLGFSEQARAWVKKFILRSEKGLCKGLYVAFIDCYPYISVTMYG